MIGVIANSSDADVVREFFELFKTPWEFYRDGSRYDVVLCSSDAAVDSASAKALLVYSSDKTAFDAAHKIEIQSRTGSGEVTFGEATIPLYGSTLMFRQDDGRILVDSLSGETVAYWAKCGPTRYVRVGYDLFQEIRTLLVQGQPTANASTPALDLHIALLRYLITGCGLPLVEIPPVPDGYSFIACLTHDLDHASIRRHKFDATMFGFLYRATLAAAVKTARGRLSPRKLLRNWAAAGKLPLVYLGLAEDFWYNFDRYLELEGGRPSTFFVIPFAGRPGRSAAGEAPAARAAGYDVSHVAEKLRGLKGAGCEIGLHGIDAWADSVKGREEGRRISEACATPATGVRMHWLYGDERTSQVLEEANFDYDSTVGYNETVGFRAGTSQVFMPLGAKRLLELPLHVMDTALFYPDRLGLTEEEAWERLTPISRHASSEGGVLVVNWHDRSIAPERLWDDFYKRLVGDLTEKGAVFCTASQTVSWFRKRRSVVFEQTGEGRICARIAPSDNDGKIPDLRLRIHRPRNFPKTTGGIWDSPQNYTDAILTDRLEFRLAN